MVRDRLASPLHFCFGFLCPCDVTSRRSEGRYALGIGSDEMKNSMQRQQHQNLGRYKGQKAYAEFANWSLDPELA